MSKFLGTQEIQGGLYINGIGGFSGASGYKYNITQSFVEVFNERLLGITQANIDDYITYNTRTENDYLDLDTVPSEYGGVQVEYIWPANGVTYEVYPPTITTDTVGREIIILNLSNRTFYLGCTVSYWENGVVYTNRAIIIDHISSSQITIAGTNLNLGFLKAVRLKAIVLPSIYNGGYGQYAWVVISKTPTTNTILNGPI